MWQGCSFSPLLYVLVSEVLSTQIRNCKAIEGFCLPGAGGLQFKISQYAKYGKGSGAKLNTTKTEAMWLGRWWNNSDTPYGLTWVNKMRILGVLYM